MSQAPGLSGTPDSGHCSRAATSASWARSSASPTSRTSRATPAISRADSIRQTASMVRVTSALATVRLRGSLGLRPQLLVPLAQLRRELVSEVLGLEDRTDLDHAVLVVGVRDPLDPLDRLVERLHLQDPVAGEQLLGLGERAVDHLPVAARELDAGPSRAGVKAFAAEHHARLHELLVVGGHLLQQLLARHLARLALLRRLDHHDDTHSRLLTVAYVLLPQRR